MGDFRKTDRYRNYYIHEKKLNQLVYAYIYIYVYTFVWDISFS